MRSERRARFQWVDRPVVQYLWTLRNGQQVYVTVDLADIGEQLGDRAYRSTRHRASSMHGAVEVAPTTKR